MGSLETLTGSYDYRLVALSIFISVFAAFAALDLTDRVNVARGKLQVLWLAGGAFAMGTGIWAMHYIGMAAFRLPLPVQYDWPTVVLSVVPAIVASGIALIIVSRPVMSLFRTVLGGVLMGGGVAAMHYIGMAAIRLRAAYHYSHWLVGLSIVIVIAISFIALRLSFALKTQTSFWSMRKFGSALIMGLAIPSMHYIGMAAIRFTPGVSTNPDLTHAVSVSVLGLASITLVTLLLLGLVVVTSIVDRHLAHQAQQLAHGRLQLQTIFDKMTDGIVVLDQQRNLIQANPAAARLLGLAEPTLSRESATEIFEMLLPNGELLPKDRWPSALALRGEFIHQQEFEIRRRDTGKSVVTEITTTPITNQAGEIVQVLVSYHDITERKRNRETQARLAAIVESSQDAIIGKDENGVVTNWNAAAEKIFGYSADEMIGRSILKLVPPSHEQEERSFLTRVKNGEVIDQAETIRTRKDGKQIQVALTISPIRNAENNVIGVSTIARDITSQRQLERHLFQRQKMEAIGQLTGGIAHDFNNLLGVIVGNLSLLERSMAGNESALRRVQTALKAAGRGADLIRRLLTFSSNEGLKPAPTSLNHSLQNMVELAARALGPEIKISTHFDESLPLVLVDSAGLESALLNLAVNARDAMPKGGLLTIATEVRDLDVNYPPVKTGDIKPGSYACISITDTGCGMSRETLERAFEPFFTTKSRDKGTGLGLAMVYGFAKQSGGTARIYSELNYGTTVRLYFPLVSGLATASPVISQRQQSVKASGTVLVVDDEPDLLEVACVYLSEMGYHPLSAIDAVRALDIVRENRNIDLVVTDIIMPGGMNGVELVQRIREFIPHIKVIYSSGFSADALAERSGTLVDGLILHKPYQWSEFDANIRQTMGGLTNGHG